MKPNEVEAEPITEPETVETIDNKATDIVEEIKDQTFSFENCTTELLDSFEVKIIGLIDRRGNR